MDQQAWIAIAIFLVIYALIISEKIHRTIVAMLGGLAVVVFGIVEFNGHGGQEGALQHIDWNTLGLLTGMMIIVTITAETGLFKYIAIWAAKKAKGEPIRILVALSLITAVASAFLDNVTTVLLMVPVTFSITRQLRVSPMPYLISQILTSNIGGTATLIGDPPNIMIGSAVPELSFLDFITNLALISIIILIVTVIILALFYRKQLGTTAELKASVMDLDERDELNDRTLLIKSLSVLGLTIVGFFAHQALHVESSVVALTGAFILLLLTGEHYLEEALARVEWTTIFFFIGLFVLVSGLVETGVIELVAQHAIEWTGGDLVALSLLLLWMSAIASAFVDNIPYVATMIPMIKSMGEMGVTNLEPLWWSLALGACLGGNGTLIGASANVIVVGMAAKEGHHISFLRFFYIAFPLMLLSIVFATVYVYFAYLI
jgi:Na+/H+ antiporter NhaD/arsenite permease-like protein